MGRYSQAQGDAGENFARIQLEMMGFSGVRKVETGWIQLASLNRGVLGRCFPALRNLIGNKKNRCVIIAPKKKVGGDLTAVEPGTGRAVMCEVKSCEDRLPFGMLKTHQHEYLRDHAENNGLALVAWYNTANGELYVMEYPIDGFVKYKSIDVKRAKQLDLARVL